MGINKSTYYLLGQAMAEDSGGGFQLGWQYSGWSDINAFMRASTNNITLNRSGDVCISDSIKQASNKLYEVGVLFVFCEWNHIDTKQILGGKFEWIGHGESGGSWHDVSRKNIVDKLESPPGHTKSTNYWYQHGAKHGPLIVSQMLKKKSGVGGVIAACRNSDGVYSHPYMWKDIPER